MAIPFSSLRRLCALARMSLESDRAMIPVHRGKEAVALMADPTSRRKWAALYEACSYGTCFQDIPFVTTWYRSYAERFEPVLVSGEVKESSLTGLLTVALSKENNTLVPAGTDRAEYQVWLARDGQSDEFIESALNWLGREFPAAELRFRYLPPGTPLAWCDRWTGQCHLRSVPRPLMSTRPGNTVAGSLRKRSMRSRLNRLERMGKIQCFFNTRWASFTFSSSAFACKKRDSRTSILLAEGSNTRSGLLHITMKHICWMYFFAPPVCVNCGFISEIQCALTLPSGYEQERLWHEFSTKRSSSSG